MTLQLTSVSVHLGEPCGSFMPYWVNSREMSPYYDHRKQYFGEPRKKCLAQYADAIAPYKL